MKLLVCLLALMSLGFAVALAIVVSRSSDCSAEIAIPRHNPDVSAEIQALEQKALSGDRAAANRLAEIYMKIGKVEERHWLEIGAENGDPVAQYNLADSILRKKDHSKAEHVRAMFWLGRSSMQGNKYARDRIQEESTRNERE